jgi:hypothetical protein
MLLPLALMLSLGATPPGAACEGERVVILPFDMVALTRAEARHTEETLRRAVAKAAGVCLEPRKETVERWRALNGKQGPCADAACRADEVKAFQAKWLIHGRVLGLGGERTLALVLTSTEGAEARSTFSMPALGAAAEDAASKAFAALWGARGPRPTEVRKRRRAWPMVLMGTGAAALVAGAGFGMAARATEKRFSEGTGGCEGDGEAFRRCFADGLRRGERQSQLATGLLGVGAVLGASGAIFFVWELP